MQKFKQKKKFPKKQPFGKKEKKGGEIKRLTNPLSPETVEKDLSVATCEKITADTEVEHHHEGTSDSSSQGSENDNEELDDVTEVLEMEEDDQSGKKRHLENDEQITPVHKKGKLSKAELFKPPTREELNSLKEAEYLFQSSLFRMQISETLDKVTVKDKHKKLLEKWLITFKQIILDIPEMDTTHRLIDQKWLIKMDVKIPINPEPFNSKGHFKYVKPQDIEVVGSFPLGTFIKPDITVDLALEMPNAAFQKSDFLNHIYHRKRAQYLAYIAVHLKDKEIKNLAFTYMGSDHLKPALLIKPEGKLGKHFTIRLLPTISQSVYKMNRFIPNTNNVRPEWYFQKEKEDAPSNYPGTPHYNTTILIDMAISSNSKFLQDVIQDTAGIREGIKLLRVWFKQRELDQGYGGFTGFILSMFVAYLLTNRKLNRLMSSYQIVRTTWLALAESDWTTHGISVAPKSSDPLQPSLEDFHKHFEVVFIDSMGFVNICANMSSTTYNRILHEVKLSLEMLNKTERDSFEPLFLTSVPFIRKFDYIIHVRLTKAIIELIVNKYKLTSLVVDYASHHQPILLPSLLSIIDKAVGQRLKLVFVKLLNIEQWAINEDPPSWSSKSLVISFGLLLNKETFDSILDKGPSADKPEAIEFRKYWGNKSDLRRFKDGSICETAVWTAETLSERKMVIFQIIEYIFQLHFGIDKECLKFTGCHLNYLLEIPKCVKLPKEYPAYGTGEEVNLIISQIFNKLIKQLYALKGLPLTITSVQGISAIFRSTETFIPLPAYSSSDFSIDNFRKIPSNNRNAPQWVPALEVNVSMEGSGKWPQDIEAIKRIKVAFHYSLSELLQSLCNLVTSPHPEYVDVMKDGYVFRLRIVYHREPTLMKLFKDTSGLVKMLDLPEAQHLHHQIEILPQLTTTLHGLGQQMSSFGAVSRLCKRWLAAQMLSAYFPEESIELVVAYLFLSPVPYTEPCSTAVGFLRFFTLLTTFDWKTNPLIVNLNDSLTKDDYAEIHQKFIAERANLPILFIATPYDRFSSYVTKAHPSGQMLNRVIQLARESLIILQEQTINDVTQPDYSQIFRPSLRMYDVLIYLKPNLVPKLYQQVESPVALFHANLSTPDDRLVPVTNFDPVTYYIRDLMDAYGDFALFFYDPCGGKVIAVLWKPAAFKPVPFRVSCANGRTPSLSGSDTSLIPNIEAIVDDFKILGHGLINRVISQMENWKIS